MVQDPGRPLADHRKQSLLTSFHVLCHPNVSFYYYRRSTEKDPSIVSLAHTTIRAMYASIILLNLSVLDMRK